MNAHPSFPDPTDDHPPVERLADLAEGLVDSPDELAALRRHLDGCAECRETIDALAEVQALLGEVTAPPMPADIAARLDAALAEAAAEAAGSGHEAAERPQERPAAGHRAGAPARPVPAATTPATPPYAPSSTPPHAPPSTPSPAGPGHRPAGRSGSATGPGRSGRRRFALLLGSAAALAALALGGALLLHPADPSGVTTAVAGGAPTAADPGAIRTPHAAGAGTAYREDELTAQIQQLLARTESAPGPHATGPGNPEAALPAEGIRPEPAAPDPSDAPTGAACPTPAAGPPLATDRGSYQGAPVDVLVYPLPGRPGFVDVYLRSPDCGRIALHQAVPSR
ncbi:hypothetical protein ACFRAR_26955 [Kitasatospora sp. NPDC056651]|uniref:zf-HC2 domain-containing protein n=1 Tax=Kitasatospora sp. NPDC056651 TaxID=3345892 RepID=UPI0036A8F88C